MTSENIQNLSYEVRAVATADYPKVEAIWITSQEADSNSFRPRGGWWSLTSWTDNLHFLFKTGEENPVGVIAATAGEAGLADFRLGLLPASRQPQAATRMVQKLLELAQQLEATNLRLFLSGKSTWITELIPAYGFQLRREFYAMLRPTAAVTPLELKPVAGIQIRPMQAGEEIKVLEALNRAWATTWGYNPITMEALDKDLQHQREGFLVAVDETNPEKPIVGTVHGMFDASNTNPDGSPFAWISNVTTDPQVRGRGLGRAVLLAGINYLAGRGAKSVGLGVDGGNPVPVSLYRSVGFEIYNTNQLWENQLTASQSR